MRGLLGIRARSGRACALVLSLRASGIGARGALVLGILLALTAAPGPAAAQTIDSIVITPSDSSLRAGFTASFRATAHYSNGATGDVSQSASWSSSSTGVAIVTNVPGIKGLVTAVGPGSARIAAELFDGVRIVRGSTGLVVTDGDLVSITTKPTTKNLEVGQASQFKATANFLDDSTDDVTKEVVWSSTNPAIASVSNAPGSEGLVTAHAVGTTTIVAFDPVTNVQNTDGATNVRAQVSHLTFDPPKVIIGRNMQYPLRVYANRVDGTRSNITDDVEFSVVPGGVIDVGTGEDAGVVIALRNGNARVSAYDPKRNLSTSTVGNDARVKVRGKLKSLHVEPNPLRMAVGEEKNARAVGWLSSGKKTSDLRRIVQWSIVNGAVGKVGNTANDVGEVVGLGSGETTLRAFDPLSGKQSPEVNNLLVLGPLQSVRLEIGDGLVPLGEEVLFKARGVYEGGIELNISDKCTWTVINPNKARVDDEEPGKGGVTGLQIGQTTVRVNCSGKQVSEQIRVIGNLVGLRVSPEKYEADALEEKQFRAFGQYDDGSEKDLTKLVAWSSSNPAVATVDSEDDLGTVRAIGEGTSSITAQKPPFSASGVVAIGAAVIGIEVSPDGKTIRGSDSIRLRAHGLLADGTKVVVTKKVVWSSSNDQIARVSNREGEQGTAYGGGTEGVAQIFAGIPDTGLVGSVNLTVHCLLTSLEMKEATKRVPVGQARRVTVRGRFCDGSSKTITRNVVYTSSNPNVVLVSNEPKSQGTLTGVSPGTATITAFDPSSGKTTVNATQVTVFTP